MLTASQLTERIALQGQSSTRNALGELVNTWATVKSCWAQVRPVTQRDEQAADLTLATGTYRFTVRACEDLAPQAVAAMRVQWAGQNYYPVGEPLRLYGAKGLLQITATSQKVNDV
jgi:SPP1 family predicted phage head-tail adaptor